MPHKDPAAGRVYHAAWRARNADKIKAWSGAWRRRHREYLRAYLKAKRVANPAKYRAYARRGQLRARQRARQEAIARYGPVCRCCSEDKLIFLCLDHVFENGGAHRRSISGTKCGPNMAIWLKRNGWPSGFQVLCFNCNWAKSHGGCPHKLDRATGAEGAKDDVAF